MFIDAPILKIYKISDSDLTDGLYSQFECTSDSEPPITNYKYLNYFDCVALKSLI